ncbi:response regulator [Pedobacter sp. Du54]|uniref:response regulator n=1 Tax=Pedobacter anseongensis TaxID=3133439 RepID=UPI0030B5F992
MPNDFKKVMLIDDNEIDLKINSKIISLANLFEEIIICQSGEESLDYLSKYINNPEKLPNFILLDIQMPEMDGFEFLEHYKNLPKAFTTNCQIAMLSSTLDFGDIKRAEANAYVVKLLKKPLLPAELAALMK